jgi:hypothetical protein
MRKIFLILFFIPFINFFSQEISLSKGTLRLANPTYVDSVTIYNKGDKILRINSIKYRKTKYAYNTDPFTRQTMWKLLSEYGSGETVIKILPNRSVTFRIKLAASLTKEPIDVYDMADVIFFYTNSIKSPVQTVKIMNMPGNRRRR